MTLGANSSGVGAIVGSGFSAEEYGEPYNRPTVFTLSDCAAVNVTRNGEALNIVPDTPDTPELPSGGCYVATSVYGSYDCPEVWTLRRFRDNVLAETWYGRLFIRLYYAVSPTAVKLFGDAQWFQDFFRGRLDTLVSALRDDGFESTPYEDTDW